jgi:Arc/MetJ family transcription regulator
MRTTVNLDDDVADAVIKLRRERGIGVSEAVNELVRAAMREERVRYDYRHPVRDMGASVDISNIGAVLDRLDDSNRL